MSMKTLTRLSYIDILKIVATFAIVLWHVSAVYVRMDAALLSPFGVAALCDQSLCALCAADVHDDLGALLLRESYALQLQAEVFPTL